MSANLRSCLKSRRNRVSPAIRSIKSDRAARHLLDWPELDRFRHIGAYLNFSGELPTRTLIRALLGRKKSLYIPVLHSSGESRLHFMPYHPGVTLVKNRFAIREPRYRAKTEMAPQALDLVLMPLLGFDMSGSRLGMGGGFYDRTLAFVQQRQSRMQRRPLLIGVAMDVQRVRKLKRQPWDVPLDGILTESGLHLFGQQDYRKKRL